MKWMIGLVLAAVVGLSGCNDAPGDGNAAAPAVGESSSPGASGGEPWAKIEEAKYETTGSGLKWATIKEGSGAAVKANDTASMHYTGWLKDGGKKFDSSRDRGEPFSFHLGHGEVIKGWDEGVEGMKVGEQRQLVIPSSLGYGDSGTPDGSIPPGATLVFDVELMEIGPSAQH